MENIDFSMNTCYCYGMRKIHKHPEMPTEIVSFILARHGEHTYLGSKEIFERNALDKQILSRIEDIFADPDRFEQEALEIRKEMHAIKEEEQEKKRKEWVRKRYGEYVTMVANKRIAVAMNYFRMNAEGIIEWYASLRTAEQLRNDVFRFSLLLQNKSLLSKVPKNWMNHTMMELFLSILQKRPDVVTICHDDIVNIAKHYPEWNSLLGDSMNR